MTAGLLAGLAAGAAEQTTAKEAELTIVLDLTDGSHLVGTPSVNELKLVSTLGKIQLPLMNVTKVVFDAAKETAEVSLNNGDRLSGIVDLSSMAIKASWGKVKIASQHVRTLTVHGNETNWNLRAEFSTSDNPTGPWAYGWTADAGTAFTNFQSKCQSRGGEGWRLDPEAPVVWINRSNHVIDAAKTGEVSLHAGSNGSHCVVRWKAPRSCKVVVKGTFGAGDSGSVDVRILHNSIELFSVADTRKDEPFALEIEVAQGDTVDFDVGAGINGYINGNTPLDADISVK